VVPQGVGSEDGSVQFPTPNHDRFVVGEFVTQSEVPLLHHGDPRTTDRGRPVNIRLKGPGQQEGPGHKSRAFEMVAGEGFEPSTFGL
jgi:hypothetical protein